jgi:chorismate mutase
MKAEGESGIGRYRAEIDEIDMALLQLIARRREVALEIAKIKQGIGSQDDEERMRNVLCAVEAKASELGLDKSEIREIWKELIAYMIKEQMRKYPY